MTVDVDRDELRAMARDMLKDICSPAAVRAVVESGTRFDQTLWKQLSDVGWAGIEAPGPLGGGGARFGDAAVVLTELGRHLTPAPLASTMVLGLGALTLAGTEEQQADWLPRLCDGAARVTAGLEADAGSARPIGTAGGGMRVSGTWSYVPDGDLADAIVLAASSDEADLLLLIPADDLDITPTPMLDLTRRFARVTANAVEVSESNVLASAPVHVLRDRAALATACDSLGVAERALAMTVAYAKTREQFGRAIGSFQAVKHECSDMLIAVETARVVVMMALAAYDTDPHSASLQISMAKAHACEAAAAATAAAVRLHGGIGFTWEHDAHLLLKRAKLNESLDGSTRFHRRRIADGILGPIA